MRGYRVPIYREQWEAAFGWDLECHCERGNAADAYAVSVMREGSMIGHLASCMHAFCKKMRDSMDEDSDLLGLGRPSANFIKCSKAIFVSLVKLLQHL